MNAIIVLILCITSIVSSANAQWEQVPISIGGHFSDIVSIGTKLYAGGEGGIFLSTDNGDHWVNILNGYSITALATNGRTLYAGTDHQGIFFTIDDGRSWIVERDLFLNEKILSIAAEGDNVLSGTGTNVFLSSDGGNSWRKREMGGTFEHSFNMNGNLFLASTWNGLFLSRNGGISWENMAIGSIGYFFNYILKTVTGLFAKDYINGNIFQLWNYGSSGKEINIGTDNTNCLATDGQYLFAAEKDGKILRISGEFKVDTIITNLTYINILFIHGTSIFISSGDDNIFRSDDGGKTWKKINLGLQFVNQYIQALASDGKRLFAGAENGAFVSSDMGKTWLRTDIYNTFVHAFASSGIYLVAGTNSGTFFSNNSGNTWTSLDSGIYGNVYSVAILDSTIFTSNGGGILKYLPTGNYSNSLWNSGPAIAMATISNRLFASDFYVDSLYLGLYQYMPDLNTWTDQQLNGCVIYCIYSFGMNSFAGTNSGLYQSTDKGSSWQKTGFQIPVKSITSDGINIFVSTDSGIVYQSQDEGISWISISQNLPSAISLFILSPYLFAGTKNASVWRRPLSQLTVSKALNTQFTFTQNYPNPFKEKTTLTFSLSEGGYAALKVFTLLGEEVASLGGKFYEAGLHQVEWDSRRAPPGVYYCQLRAGNLIETKEMVISR